jgi:hypothetical protein
MISFLRLIPATARPLSQNDNAVLPRADGKALVSLIAYVDFSRGIGLRVDHAARIEN